MALELAGRLQDRDLVWPLEGDAITVGRSSRHPVQIPDAAVSKDHAELRRDGIRWLVRDLGSRNGTRVNGVEAREPLELKVGDRLEIGHVVLQVRDPSSVPVPPLRDATIVDSSMRVRADQMLKGTPASMVSEAAVRLLAEAGRMLVVPRPLNQTCEELLAFVERAVPASRYLMLLRESPDRDPVIVASRTKRGREGTPLAMSRAIMRTVLDEWTSVITRDAAMDPRFAANMSIVAQAVHSAMAVPLFDNERVLGLVYVDSQEPTVSFDDQQLELLTLLANMAAVKITNARLLESEAASARMVQELAVAARTQRGLLPAERPQVDGWNFEGFLESCYEVGGDLYDFQELPDGRVMFLLGDVTGKGMGAALLMSSFLSSARVLYGICEDLGDLATRLGSITFRNTDAIHYVTAFLGRLDPRTGSLEYVNAGHPSPALVRAGALRELESTGVPFGVLPSFRYDPAATNIDPGELFVLFSDGIPEAQRGEEFFDNDRLHRVLLETPADDLESLRRTIVEAVRAFVGEAPRSDDLTLVLIRRAGG